MTKERILVVDDEKDIRKLLKYNLETAGYEVATASTGEEAFMAFHQAKPGLVILDVMLPGTDGLETCRLIRTRDTRIPILMLSAKGREADKVAGLELGADDYVSKPFSIKELLARVKSLLRRGERSAEGGQELLSAGSLEMDLGKYEVRVGKKALSLTTKEFDLLRLFLKSNGKVLTREKILENVWGYDKAFDLDTRTIDQHMARLREKLGPENDRLITVKKVGYRFVLE